MWCIGPDPADPSRVLIKRVNQIGDGKWAYEEVTLSKDSDTETEPTVHSTMHKIALWDLYRKFDAREEALQRNFKPRPCVTSFSLFYTKTGEKWNPLFWLPSWALGMQGGQYTIVENSFVKTGEITWNEWWQNFTDKRDMSIYLRNRMRWGY